jgi:hypothetical protein
MLLKRKNFKKNGGNGHNGPEQLAGTAPMDGGSFDPFGDLFSSASFGTSLVKELLEWSDSIPKLAMKSSFALARLPDHLKVISCYMRYKRFNQERDLEGLRLLLASAPNIGNLRNFLLIMADAKIISEQGLKHAMDISTEGVYQEGGKRNKNHTENKMLYPSGDNQEQNNGQ